MEGAAKGFLQEQARNYRELEKRLNELTDKCASLMSEQTRQRIDLEVFEAKSDELEERAKDLQWTLSKRTTRLEQVELQLDEARKRAKAMEESASAPQQPEASHTVSSALKLSAPAGSGSDNGGGGGGASSDVAKQLQQLMEELEDVKHVSEARLAEIDGHVQREKDLQVKVSDLTLDVSGTVIRVRVLRVFLFRSMCGNS